MPKIHITSVDANHIKVEFNDYFVNENVDISEAFYNRNDIELIEVYSGLIKLHLLNTSQDWQFSDVENLTEHVYQIDDIDGTTTWADLPTLASQLAALMKA